MRSFIVRVYRRGHGGGLSGTVQPVGAASTPAPRAFASTAELLMRLQAAPQDAPGLAPAPQAPQALPGAGLPADCTGSGPGTGTGTGTGTGARSDPHTSSDLNLK